MRYGKEFVNDNGELQMGDGPLLPQANSCEKIYGIPDSYLISPIWGLKYRTVGCSTGNFLLHLRRALPDLELVGGELAESSLEICRHNPDLAGSRSTA